MAGNRHGPRWFLAPSLAWYRSGEGGAMRLAVYGVVLAIALGSVLFGLDWLSAPMSPMVDTKAGLSAVPPPVAPKAEVSAATTPSAAVAPNAAKPTPAAPAQPRANLGAPIVAPGLSPSQSAATQSATQSPSPSSNQNASPVPVSSAAAQADVPGVPAEPQARCNVNACTAAYRSFTPSDCTYQPSNGPRRLCTK